jgi:hypothetical protein
LKNGCLTCPNVFIANRVKPRNTKSFNTAFKRSTGSYIIDFATDDLLHSDCVATQLEQFKTARFLILELYTVMLK